MEPLRLIRINRKKISKTKLVVKLKKNLIRKFKSNKFLSIIESRLWRSSTLLSANRMKTLLKEQMMKICWIQTLKYLLRLFRFKNLFHINNTSPDLKQYRPMLIRINLAITRLKRWNSHRDRSLGSKDRIINPRILWILSKIKQLLIS